MFPRARCAESPVRWELRIHPHNPILADFNIHSTDSHALLMLSSIYARPRAQAPLSVPITSDNVDTAACALARLSDAVPWFELSCLYNLALLSRLAGLLYYIVDALMLS